MVCSTRLVSGKVKLTFDARHIRVSVSRGRVVYAAGRGVRTGADIWRLVLKANRTVRPGRYILTLQGRHNARSVTYRRSVTIT
jgi:hypothetical protein